MPTSGPGPIVINNLFDLALHIDSVSWEPFRAGVRIHRLYGVQTEGPSAALLLYEPGAGIPLHEHLGYEHLIILSHSQTEERGERTAGTLVINPPGSSHSVLTKEGTLVLAIWEKPVRFIDPES
jgi:anti-sigma factor ChrR (cupin superfamily)